MPDLAATDAFEGLGLPLGYVYAAMPVGAALILVPMAWRFVGALRDLWQKPS